nr:cyclin-dependent kinase inhibitor 1C-like [Aegilops tauschii subsp. strangulata]
MEPGQAPVTPSAAPVPAPAPGPAAPVPAPAPAPAPAPRLPPPATSTDAVVAEMVAATHVSQKWRRAGTHLVPSKPPVPAPAAKPAKPAGEAAKPAKPGKPATSTAAATKRKEKALLDDAEVNITSPPLASFDFHVEEPTVEEGEAGEEEEAGEEDE